jgi:predicted TIM-barrel fold metal-dependent hydrolase
MYKNLQVFDADSHVMEPHDFWSRYIAPEFKDRAPVANEGGMSGLSVEGRRVPTVQFKRMAALNEMWRTKYGEYAERGWDPTAFIMAMDRQGIDRMALYPSRGLSQAGVWGLDPKLAGAIVGAYNGWIHDFCTGGEGRLIGIGQLDLRDVDGAIAEARRGVSELGFRGFFVLPEPPLPGVTLDRPYYDPLWSAIEALNVPIGLHDVAGTGLGQIGADRYGEWAAPRIAFAFPLEAQAGLFPFLLGGICERHPRLRVVILESGAGWLPYWLWYLDELYERYKDVDLPPLSLKPSDYFRRQCFISAEMEEPTLKYVVDYLGSGNIVTATDFPHPEGTFPEGVREFIERPDLGPDVKRKILWDNPCKLYGFA